jgi:regulator of cell morphogenesis and NO signaling
MSPLQPSVTVSQLASECPASVNVLQRHGIDFSGAARSSLADVCRQLALDPITILAEIHDEERRRVDAPEPPLNGLVEQMLRAYHHVLREELPRLHRLAQRVMQSEAHRDAETLAAVVDAFLELRSTLEEHVAREERAVGPLVSGGDAQGATAMSYALRQEHDAIGTLLRRLRRLTRDYTPPDGAGLAWHELWRGLEALEVSLHDHVRLVNNVMFLCTITDGSPHGR